MEKNIDPTKHTNVHCACLFKHVRAGANACANGRVLLCVWPMRSCVGPYVLCGMLMFCRKWYSTLTKRP